jgi:hypothetical protein
MSEKINARNFYAEYHGHRLDDLEKLHHHLRGDINRSLVFLSGDSSLDNKHWFQQTDNSINGYETILSPPLSRLDINYWINSSLLQHNIPMSSINCAIEESTVGGRACGHLLPQDIFIRDNIQSNDILVISVGGNDIALKPSCCTILNILGLTYCSTQSCINSSCGTSIPFDDCFCGCVCSCLSNCLAFPCGLGYFIHLFKTRVQAVVNNITAKTRPKFIFVCMIYYLDEKRGNSWAEYALSGLQYNQNPKKLQSIISKLFELATKEISIPGTTVIGIPLFEALNGKDSADYVERVEPSAQGGRKMGSFIVKEILKALNNGSYQGTNFEGEPEEKESMIRK